MNYILFPYERVKQGSRCVIYGMGYLGKEFVRQIESNNYCKIPYAVDKNFKSLTNTGVMVKSIEDLHNDDCDFVVIAVVDSAIALEIATMLKEKGISSEKLIYDFKPIEITLQGQEKTLKRIEWFLEQPVCRMLYGFESYMQNQMLLNRIGQDRVNALYYKPRKISELLQVYDIVDSNGEVSQNNFVRAGKNGDGGYVIVDQTVNQEKILYSFGVGYDISFELYMVKRGYEAYLYDYTVDGLPEKNEKCHFFKKGLAGVTKPDSDIFFTLPEFMDQNRHQDKMNMFLKIDIEGGETEVFLNLPIAIQKLFSQIVVEWHDLTHENRQEKIIAAMERLNSTHRLVHFHPNNYSRMAFYGDKCLSDVVECTYVRKDDYDFKSHEGLTMTELDAPCDIRYRTERYF
ncbi:MAG: FkbM family methyltransferase [Selenomonadaceae bacterium]|nr:FkbM family methyltransferase [Selenomonadaceae bacterium]